MKREFGVCLLTLLLSYCSLGRVAAQTGTFIDRHLPTDLRVVSYNVWVSTIFPNVNSFQADKFERVVNALDPDILNLQEISQPAEDVVDLLNSIAPIAGGTWYAHQRTTQVIVSKYPLSMLATSIDPHAVVDPSVALVDLPDTQYGSDFYVINHHLQNGCNEAAAALRQQDSDAVIRWLDDARTPDGSVDLPDGTPIAVVGDMNNCAAEHAIETLVTGDIIDEETYGPDSPPDWDGTSFTDARPLINGSGPEDYTFRYPLGSVRIDHVLYSDSAVDVANKFVLNTVDMSPADLNATGLQTLDVTIDSAGAAFDHLPVVVDFRVLPPLPADFSGDGVINEQDLRLWQISYRGPRYDLNNDGQVSGSDFLEWQRSYHDAPPGVDESPANLDGIGPVDSGDVSIWEQSYGVDDVADLDGDGDSDGYDFLNLQRSFTPFAVADRNFDRRVNGHDLLVWEGEFGYDGLADANQDGATNGLDFLIWQRTLSDALPLLAQQTQAVPEPSASLLLFGLATSVTLVRFRTDS